MKTVFGLVMASFLLVATASFVSAQDAEVTHNTWTSGTAMPTAVAFATAAVLKNEIYVVGGNNGTENVADVQIYNPATGTWSTGVSYPTKIGSASSAVVKNILYVFGGSSDGMTPSNAVWAYNPKTKAWTAMEAMPTARWGSEAVVEKNIIYVIGGAANPSGNDFVATVESYNPVTNTWTEEAPMLVARAQSAAGLIGTTIVVADGGTDGQGTSGDNEGYDSATNTWRTLASDPASRYASCFGSIGPKIYDMGGQTATTYSNDFQLSKDEWTPLAPVPQSVIFPASAVYKKQLYCFGGWSANGGPVNGNVQIYQP
ncbi:MAG: kelch repeat-containing protein [Terriglobales bacterium]